jgi:heat shock protein HslJ
MQSTHEQYVGAGFGPYEQEQYADKTTTTPKVVFAVLALALGLAVGAGVAWTAGKTLASGPTNTSAAIVTSSTPSEAAASPAITPPVTTNPAASTLTGGSGGSGGSGTSGSSTGSVHVVDNTAPKTPKLISPSDGVIVSDSGVHLTLKWSKVTDPSGVRYRVQIQQWIGGGAGWQAVKLVKGLKSTHYGLSVGAMRVRWRVIAVDLVGNESDPTAWRTIDPVSPLVLLQDKKWLLSAISDGAGGMLDPLDGTHAFIRFDSDTGNVGGSTGVNAFGAPFSATEDGAIHVGMITSTMMASSPDAMKQEMLLKNALTGAVKWQLTNNYKTLKLLTAGGDELAVFTR